jgi:hypothetical protein
MQLGDPGDLLVETCKTQGFAPFGSRGPLELGERRPAGRGTISPLMNTTLAPTTPSGMIDIHCHLLPGIDDGPPTLEAALALAHALVQDGITQVVCTPHVFPGRFENRRSSISDEFDAFAAQVAAAGLPLRLLWAGEVRLTPEVLDLLPRQELPYLGRHNWRRPSSPCTMRTCRGGPWGMRPMKSAGLFWSACAEYPPSVWMPARMVMRWPSRSRSRPSTT